MAQLDKNKLGLIFGVFFALLHAIWALAIAVSKSGMQKLIDWIISLHFLSTPVQVQSFSIADALLLVVMTFVAGFVFGWLFAAVFNWLAKK